jgi:ribosome-associated toxin RatA of RatAB toxin-antitoxin module
VTALVILLCLRATAPAPSSSPSPSHTPPLPTRATTTTTTTGRAVPVVEELADPDGTPGLRAVFDVDAAADLVLDLLWDVRRFKAIFPDIHSLEVVGRPDDATVDVRFVVDAVVAQPTYTLRRSVDRAARVVRWRNIAGDLDRVVGRWHVVPVDATRCRVTYESFVDVGVVGVSGMYRSIVRGKVDQMADRVRAAAAKAAGAPATSTEAGAPKPP